MAIDYGGKRIGVAVSDSGVLATPHSVVRNQGDIVERLANLGGELAAETIVVGIPRRTHASANDRKYRELADRPRQKTSKQGVLWEEALPTARAAEGVRAAGLPRRAAQPEA